MNRRGFLAALVATPPILALQTSPLFAQNTSRSDLLNVSEFLSARAPLNPTIAARIENFLLKRDTNFPEKLKQLANKIAQTKPDERDQLIAALSDEDAETAIKILSAWYLGYIGTPSSFHMENDAEFVTFLSALMYEPTADNIVRPSYAQNRSDDWGETPHGVNEPPMHPNIREWGALSPQAASTYTDPDPAYLLVVEGKAKTVKEAETLLANEAHSNQAKKTDTPSMPAPDFAPTPQKPVGDTPASEPVKEPDTTHKLDLNFDYLGEVF